MHSIEAKFFLIRHGETPWALSGQHTGNTDIPLTEKGVSQAKGLSARLKPYTFSTVFSSPLVRASDTCKYAGFSPQTNSDLREWNYGKYEGLTSEQIHKDSPGWNVFVDGTPGGESPVDIQARIDRFLKKTESISGLIAIFSHGHFLRSFAARWLHLPLSTGAHLHLDPASISILGYEHKIPAILSWNEQ